MSDNDRSTTDLEIKLTFHTDSSSKYPVGYWVAEAGEKGRRADWDGVGATPLDAVMSLAKQMHKALHRQETAP